MKRFNTTGTCIPEKHYMADTSGKLKKIASMIDAGKYFTINRPRQYGKTTTLYLLERNLADRYFVIRISFEGIGDLIFQDEKIFSREFLDYISQNINNENLSQLLKEASSRAQSLKDVSKAVSDLTMKADKKVVLMVDEVDKSSNNQIFLSFLGMLRSKYLLAAEGKDTTFHSVILAGVHDVKTFKLKLRREEQAKYNSPWNIAVNFNVDLSLSAEEIATMLREYADEKKVRMDILKISGGLYYYTSGYPFLTSRLCELIDTEVMKDDAWELEDVDTALRILLKESNTNFDSLIKNLENNQELYEMVKSFIIDGETVSFNLHNPLVYLGALYGIFKDNNGQAVVHNRIYEQILYNYMTSKIEAAYIIGKRANTVYLAKGALDMQQVLLKFQQFMKENYSNKDEEFLERNGKLLLLAFIRPIINGKGFDFKEVQISEEKRLDIVITYLNQKFVVETKIWRGGEYHEKGLQQLGDYLEWERLDKGYLVIFDSRRKMKDEWKQEKADIDGKEIFMVWV